MKHNERVVPTYELAVNIKYDNYKNQHMHFMEMDELIKYWNKEPKIKNVKTRFQSRGFTK